jgi:hypothetical protein
MHKILVNVLITVLTNMLAKILTNATNSTTFAELKQRVKQSDGLIDDFFLELFEGALGVVEENGPEIADKFKNEMEKLKT